MPGIAVKPERRKPRSYARRIAGLVLAGALCLSAAACRRDTPPPEISATLQFTPASPVVDRETQVDVVLTTRDGTSIETAAVRIEAHMEHPGMAPVVADATGQRGRYTARVTFTMAGEWVVFVTGQAGSPPARMRLEAGRVTVRHPE